MQSFLFRKSLILLTFGILALIDFLSGALFAASENEFPVLHHGRYRPAEAYARLWLYDIYHAQKLKKEDLTKFHSDSSSALDFLWSLAIDGSPAYKKSPLFWISSKEVKESAQLPLTRNRFSYDELYNAIYQNQQTSQSIIRRLISYRFLQSPLMKTRSSPIELSSLLPGLWVKWQGDSITVAATPANSPWPFLIKGYVLSTIATGEIEKTVNNLKSFVENWTSLLAALQEFENLSIHPSNFEQQFQNRLIQLQSDEIHPKEIQRILEKEFPLIQRLQQAGTLFKTLPSRYKEGEWFSINALSIQVYNPLTQSLDPIGNFTLFSDADFNSIRQAYLNLKQDDPKFSPTSQKTKINLFANALSQAYQPLAGKIFQKAHGKHLSYPTLKHLKTESVYISFPWIPLLIFLYGLGACLWIVSRFAWPMVNILALSVTSIAILLHTSLLAMRWYILGRPPVSNMFETVVYVPWVACFLSLLIPAFRKQPLVLLAACISSIVLLFILEMTDLNQSLDQVQAVLDSQFWLMIHVLLVVGSYGIFILGAILGHFFLGHLIYYRRQTNTMKLLGQLILQTMYGGTILLIIGTILGGIWAAESWGRFWDWDPKESWAFISICFYLLWIHAYRFQRIGYFGLAMGAVSGLIAISFTWYGVNYILGTGLHSYGFGSGGEIFYYLFLGAELLFIAAGLLGYYRMEPAEIDTQI